MGFPALPDIKGVASMEVKMRVRETRNDFIAVIHVLPQASGPIGLKDALKRVWRFGRILPGHPGNTACRF